MEAELKRVAVRTLRIVKAKDVQADDTEYHERRMLIHAVKLLRRKYPDKWNELVAEKTI